MYKKERYIKVKRYVGEKLKSERGAVTLLVFVTVLTFAAVLLGAYLTVTALQKSQLESDIRIQEIYGEDVERVNEIYDELSSKDSQKPTCNITYDIVNETNINYKFLFDENIKNFELNDVKVYNTTILNTGLESQMQLSTSSPSYSASLTNGKTYVITFDYKCITDTQDFEIGMYSETNPNLSKKKLTASSEIKREDYRISVTEDSVSFKMIAQIANSNNITISNFKILEIKDEEIAKGSLVKVDSTQYTLMCEYDVNKKYVITIEKDSVEDFSGNKNNEIIYSV